MKNLLSTIILLLTLGFTYSQVTETFDGATISGGSFTTNSGLRFTTTDNFESYGTDLQNGGVTLTAPIPHVYLDQSGSYFEFTPTSTDKLLSSLSFDLWYSNSNSGTTLACECKSYDSSGNLLETITKDVIAKAYTFSGTPKKVRCNITEINSGNAVFFDDLTFTLVDESSTSESVPFSFNSTNPLGIESTFSNNSTGNYSFSVGIANTASGEHSSAFGQETTASGLSSLASGILTTASGIYSTAIGNRVVSSGDNTLASGLETTAIGNSSFAGGKSTTSSGDYSFAFGSSTSASGSSAVSLNHQTAATGNASLAIGSTTQSIGENSFAGGLSTQSTGYSSAALGRETVASGNHSLSIGQGTNSHAFNSVALGQYNSVSNTANPDTYLTTNTALVIGNGTDANNRSNAFKVLFDGTTTVAGSVTASSFIGDGSGLTSLPLVVESINEGGNTGVRLSSANAANHGDIGDTAVDLSYQGSASSTTGATGDYSTAMGYNTTASGFNSVAMGYRSIASGLNSFAIGYGTTSEGNASTGTPYYRNEALEERSFVIGGRNKATGFKSFTLGNDNLAQGVGSSSIGENNISTGDYSMALGLFSESVAYGSFSFGNNAYADGYNTTAIGSANTVDDSAIADQWNQNNRAFVIGNGFYDIDNAQLTRSDAFTVWFNGDATLAGNLNINSDARLKANIVSLGATLTKLLQIDGKSYTMKKDDSEKQKIGLLAQDIEKVFPELVSESNGIKSVNYQGLVPVLINALKEQDVLIKEQQRILSKQQSEVDELKSMMQKIIEKL